MKKPYTESLSLPDLSLWARLEGNGHPVSFDLEVTARCNLDCRHCYINLPAADGKAKKSELSLAEISHIADQAAELGCLWCLITGGEPLLRPDFSDLYLLLKKKGLLVSIFTNATLVTDDHLSLFKRYPPRDIEVSVYGVTPETYEKVTRKKGSFRAFLRGVGLLLEGGLAVRFKAMALRTNLRELPEIAGFCQARTKDYFRFDPFLHARYDGDPVRNAEIRAERLSAEEIVALERSDAQRFQTLKKNCGVLILEDGQGRCDHLFRCGAGIGSFTVGYNGQFRLCDSLFHPACVCDLRKETLKSACLDLVPRVRELRSVRKTFLENCRPCPLINFCMWCPAHAHLETGELDQPVGYFCDLAHARAAALKEAPDA